MYFVFSFRLKYSGRFLSWMCLILVLQNDAVVCVSSDASGSAAAKNILRTFGINRDRIKRTHCFYIWVIEAYVY